VIDEGASEIASQQIRRTRGASDRPAQLVALGVDRTERDGVLLAFGQNLKERRRTAGLSQVKLASRCFLRRDHISAFERGVRAPSLILLLVLADGLGVSAGDLADGLPAPTRRAGKAQALALITSQPGIGTAALAESLRLPSWYVTQIVRHLQATGAISGPAGWHAVLKQAAGVTGSALQPGVLTRHETMEPPYARVRFPTERGRITLVPPGPALPADRAANAAGGIHVVVAGALVSILTRAVSWELASASEALVRFVQTPAPMDRSAGLDEHLARFDAARSLLDETRCAIAKSPCRDLQLDGQKHGPVILAALRRELRHAEPTLGAVQRDRLWHDQRRGRDRICALRRLAATVESLTGELQEWGLNDRDRAFEHKMHLLTTRQIEVLGHLSRGRRYSEIAATLCIDVETVRTHAKHIRRKLGVRKSRELDGIYVPERSDQSDRRHPVS
jgi:DNA-binding CsgD family transcriptional regulator/transcriptional regulator with XRE-family HTH domain